MSDRWQNRPRRVNVWEVRSARRYGSQNETFVKTEAEARAYAERKIADAGSVGRIKHIERNTVGGTLYYDEFEELG